MPASLSALDDIVTQIDGRPCITALAYLKLPKELRRWVRDNCTTEPYLDVYFLPVGESEEEK